MPRDPCSELEATIAQLALHIGTDPNVKDLAGVAAEMQKHIPEINRDEVVRSIVAYTTEGPKNLTAIQKKLADLKREARNDTNLRERITDYQKAVASVSKPPGTLRRTSAPSEIVKLREELDGLRQQVKANDPAARAKIQDRIADLERHIAAGTVPPKLVKAQALADVQALRDKRDTLYRQAKLADPSRRAAIQDQIRELEAHLANKTQPAPKPAAPAPPADVAALRSRRDELRAKLKEADPASRESLRKQIAELQGHINAGTQPPAPGPRKAPPADIAALRAERDTLRQQLDANSPQAQADVQARIAELEGHLKAGTLPPKKAGAAYEPEGPIVELRAKRDALMKAIEQSDPALRKRFEAQIADLTDRLEGGDMTPAPKTLAPPMSKELERLAYQRDRLRSEINQRIRAMKPKTFWQKTAAAVSEPINLARSIMTSLDLSGLLRQGGFFTLGHPVRGMKALGASVKAWASPAKAHAINQAILDRPNAPMYARTKLYLAPLYGSLTKQEEAFMSRLGNKIPGIAGSQRAYVTLLNQLRADSFDAMTETLTRTGEPTLAEATAIADFINVVTGRGSLGAGVFERSATTMNTLFFAPRYVASRFQLLAGSPLYKGTGRTRKLMAQEYARAVAGLGVVYGLANLSGAEVEIDPRSSDFGKLRFGTTRIDPLMGLSQAATLISRIASGEVKKESGELVPIRGNKVQFGQKRSLGILGQFARSKLSPAVGLVADVLEGKNYVGEPITPASTAKRLLLPMSGPDIVAALEQHGIAKGTAMGLLSFFGMGLQTRDPDPARERKLDAEKRRVKAHEARKKALK